MFSGKYTHVKELIERIYRAYPFEEVFEDEVKEHVYDALSYLGRHEFLEDMCATITISEFKGLLPENISEGGLLGVREATNKVVMIPSSDIFMYQNQNDSTQTSTGIVQGISWTSDDLVDIGNTVELTENNIMVDITSSPSLYTDEQYVYRVSGRYIFTGFRNGAVEVSYKSFPVWEDDGSPKIPDDSKIMRMLVSYISLKIATRLLFKGKIPQQLFQLIESDYLFDIGAARNRLIQPDLNELESIKRSQMRLLPKPNQFANGFKYRNEQERLKGN